LNIISPTINQIDSSARLSHTTNTRTHQEVLIDNQRYLESEALSPRSTTTINTNINFYTHTSPAGFSSERQISEPKLTGADYKTSSLYPNREGALTGKKRKTHLIMPFERLGQPCHQTSPNTLISENSSRPRSSNRRSNRTGGVNKSAFRIRSPEERQAIIDAKQSQISQS
jgi:hypothetical protein